MKKRVNNIIDFNAEVERLLQDGKNVEAFHYVMEHSDNPSHQSTSGALFFIEIKRRSLCKAIEAKQDYIEQLKTEPLSQEAYDFMQWIMRRFLTKK